MNILIIDNYDSFTYNLADYLTQLTGKKPDIFLNDQVDEDILAKIYSGNFWKALVISPGPGHPGNLRDFGVCQKLVKEVPLPLLGVCLGHQGLCHLSGSQIVEANELFHGRTSRIKHIGRDLFAELPNPLEVVRYHSLAAQQLSEQLELLAWTDNNEIMAVKHKELPAWGVQFHPESYLTQSGMMLLNNFLQLAQEWWQQKNRRNMLSNFSNTESSKRSLSEVDFELTAKEQISINAVRKFPNYLATPDRFENLVKPQKFRLYKFEIPVQTASEFSQETEKFFADEFGEKSTKEKAAIDISELFDSLYHREKYVFWLDSAKADSKAESVSGRFSYLGDANGKLGRVLTMKAVADGKTELKLYRPYSVETELITETDGFDFLATHLANQNLDTSEYSDIDIPFQLGWVGYLGYELKTLCGANGGFSGLEPADIYQQRSQELSQKLESVAAKENTVPESVLFFVDRMLVIDHEKNIIYGLGLYLENGDNLAELQKWEAKVRAVIDKLLAEKLDSTATERIRTFTKTSKRAGYFANIAADMETEKNIEGITNWWANHDESSYLNMIRSCQNAISRGESYELCLTNQLHANWHKDPFETYLVLRSISPTNLCAYLNCGDFQIASTSPERFIKITAAGIVESKPIKGTVRRSNDSIEDQKLALKLKNSEKERAENLMIVDLVRNDFARVALPGTVQVEKIFDIESYATVHQLVSTITARLPKQNMVMECIRSVFPGGSMTGAPKIRSMQILAELEQQPRGIYSGGLGYFSLTGEIDLAMVIRTAIISDGFIHYGVGGAITALSNPQEEYEETMVKAIPFFDLLNRAN